MDITFNGRELYGSKFNLEDYADFVESISAPEEWVQWTFLIEGDVVTTMHDFDEGLKSLKSGSVFIVDQKNKLLTFMNKETFELNCEEIL
jgi:hypothetical protein